MTHYRVEYNDKHAPEVIKVVIKEVDNLQAIVNDLKGCRIIKIEEVEITEPLDLLKQLLPTLPMSVRREVELTIATYGDK